MSYTPNNNPYIPGDPYSYDLKWIVSQIKNQSTILATLDEKIAEAITSFLDQHDPIYYADADELIASDIKPKSLAYIMGYHTQGDGGANLYYVTDDYNDIISAPFYLTLSGANRWALPIILTPYVTPEMFGAYGDGTKDDTAAFMIACQYNVVTLSGKTYVIYDSGIDIADDCTIVGNNATLLLKSEETNSHIARITGRKNITITGVIFDGSEASGSTYASALQFINCDRITVEACKFSNFTNNAVLLSACSNSTVKYCQMDTTGLTVAYNGNNITFSHLTVNNCVFPYHLQLKSCQKSIITDCHVVMNDSSEFAIMVSYGNTEPDPEANEDNIIENCIVEYSGTVNANAAYRVNGPSNNITLHNCIAKGATIQVSNTTNAKIIECSVIDSTNTGIIANNIPYSIIKGCYVKGSYYNGIGVMNQDKPLLISDNVLLDNNTIVNVSYREIAVASGCSYVDIINNYIAMTTAVTYLIGLSSNPSHVRVINNTCEGGSAIINGAPDISTSIVEGNGYGYYRGFNGYSNMQAEITVRQGQTIIGKYFNSAPVTGTFAAGDIAYIKTPTPAVPLGWSYDGAAWNVM